MSTYNVLHLVVADNVLRLLIDNGVRFYCHFNSAQPVMTQNAVKRHQWMAFYCILCHHWLG